MKKSLKLALALCVVFLPARLQAAPPNIVIFVSDDHTATDSGVYGAKDVKTPHMDRLAAEGMTFDRAFAPSPSCAPSRAVLLTGLMPVRNGAEPNHSEPRREIKKFPAYLKELGYEVVSFGKVGHYMQTANYGFDLATRMGYHEDIAVPEALEWLKNRKSEKPLCIFVGTNWPHVPWPVTAEGNDPQKISVPGNQVDTKVTRQARARYYAGIARMDADLGLVYQASKDKFGDDFFFLHFSDQGAQWPFGKWCLYDDGLRVPLIAAWPGKVKAGSRTGAMVSLVDVLPTVVEVAGGKAPADIDGRSFAGVLAGKSDKLRERIFATHSGDGDFNVYPSRCVRDERWKYIRNLHPEFKFTTHITKAAEEKDGAYWGTWINRAKTDPDAAAKVKAYQERPAEELYDLQADPMEKNNLAASPAAAEVLSKMRSQLDGWMKEQGDESKVFGKPTLIHEAGAPAGKGAGGNADEH